jgi:N4-gp56 family major capsid protein
VANETQTSTNNNMLATYLNRRLLKVLDEKVWLYEAASKYPLPDREGVDMVWNSWRRIAPASATISQTLTSPGYAVLSSRKVTAAVVQYGRPVAVTSLFEQTGISSALQGAVERLTQSAALTLDNICQLAVFKNNILQVGKDGSDTKTKLVSGAWQAAQASAFCADTGTMGGSTTQFGLPVVFATSSARLSVSLSPTISSIFGPIGIRKAVDRLRRLDAEPYADGLYMGFTHTGAVTAGLSNPDLKAWYVNFQGGPAVMYKGEFTTPLHGVKFKWSTNMPRFATSALSCHFSVILGQECLGVTELSPGGAEMIVKRPGEQTTNDPFNMLNIVSYKIKAVAKVLNPSAGVILISQFTRKSGG